MAGYTQYGPFSDGSSPGVSAEFLNPVETFLLSLNAASYDTNVSSDGAGNLSFASFKPTGSVVLPGTTSGTATLYQFLQGTSTVKAFYLKYNNYRNSGSTEQKIALPVAFTFGALFFAGGVPQSHLYSGGSALGAVIRQVTSFPNGSGGAGGENALSTINGYMWGEIPAAFDSVGLGTSQSGTFTTSLFVIGQ